MLLNWVVLHFLQLFISNVQVVTNMSSGVTSNSKYTTYGSLRIGGQCDITKLDQEN